MRVFFYYVVHSVKNQIRKLFKTWVAVFFAVCLLIGFVLGIGISAIESLVEDDDPTWVEVIDSENDTGEEPPSDEGEGIEEPDTSTSMSTEELYATIEAIFTALLLLLFIFEAMGADKNGSNIFNMADVNLLFASPMKPQSVLMFRLCCQMGAMIFLGVYLLIEVPVMIESFGLTPLTAVVIVLIFALSIIFGKLLNVLLYTIGSTHTKVKRFLRPCIYGVLMVVALGYMLFWQKSALSPWIAARDYFSAVWTRYIPVFGWLKAMVMLSLEENVSGMVICGAGLLAALIGMIVWIWHIKADFYEDAMAKSAETAELLQAAQQTNGTGLVRTRKKDRSDKLLRDGMKHGWGANVFFFKSMYNRFRFAHLRYFTKTAETYLIAAVGVSFFERRVWGMDSIIPVALVIAGLAFFRSLGNPLSQDAQMDLFLMVPADPWAKMFWSLLGGTVNCALDCLPGMLIATIILGANPLVTLAWLLFVVSVDLYSTSVATFLDLSIPVSIGKPVKQAIQILFIYFGLVPGILILVVGGALGVLALGAVGAALFHVAIGALFFSVSPLFLVRGRK